MAEDYKRSIPWIRGKIFYPRPVVIVCDATFYGKRKDKFGTLVFKGLHKAFKD